MNNRIQHIYSYMPVVANRPTKLLKSKNIVTCPTYPEKFTRENVIAPFLLLSVFTVSSDGCHLFDRCAGRNTTSLVYLCHTCIDRWDVLCCCGWEQCDRWP